MGCSCSNNPLTHPNTESARDQKKNVSSIEVPNLSKKQYSNAYKYTFQAEESAVNQTHFNFLFFTCEKSSNDFITFDWEGVEKVETSPFKLSYNNIAVGYNKGYKIDSLNQDKFFFLVDGENEAFCIVDGHGPFGDIIAQIVQNKFFASFTENFDQDIETEYQKIFERLFSNIQQSLINREMKDDNEYDPFLSGCAITVVVKKRKFIYCANVGNVLAFLVHNDKLCPSKIFIDQLTLDDSRINIEQTIEKNTEVKNIHNDFNMNEELRRIYENGGEIRKLAGEDVNRIFIKGKYFPGVINTRALGDHIGNGIGIYSEPHVGRFHLKPDTSYKLVMCTDGISNVCSIEKMVNILQENDNLFLDSINMIISESQQYYRNSAYSPDMTLMIKEVKRRKIY